MELTETILRHIVLFGLFFVFWFGGIVCAYDGRLYPLQQNSSLIFKIFAVFITAFCLIGYIFCFFHMA